MGCSIASGHENNPSSKSNLLSRVLSGSVGSIITSLVVTPLDVVKVRVQANSMEGGTVGSTPSSLRNVVPCPRGCGTFILFNGQMDCVLPKSAVSFFDPSSGKLTQQARSAADLGTFRMIRRIFATEGLSGIYAGLTPTLVMSVPNTVLYFSAYDESVWQLRRLLSSDSSKSWIPLVAGGSARLVASTVTAPFEFLRTRQASRVGHNESPMGMVSELRSIVREEGFKTLYRGLRPTLWRDVPFSGIYWFVLEKMKEQWIKRFDRLLSPSEQATTAFVNGFVSGIVAAACTTPFDVIKTRTQALARVSDSLASSGSRVIETCSHGGATVYEVPRRSAGTFEYLVHIVETDGVPGLWRGNQARMLKVAPSCAIMISTYEFGKQILR